MGTATKIDLVRYRWDAPVGVEPGWYAESWSAGEMVDDSQKIWFGVDVDQFAHDQWSDLEDALQAAFPNAEIVYED